MSTTPPDDPVKTVLSSQDATFSAICAQAKLLGLGDAVLILAKPGTETAIVRHNVTLERAVTLMEVTANRVLDMKAKQSEGNPLKELFSGRKGVV